MYTLALQDTLTHCGVLQRPRGRDAEPEDEETRKDPDYEEEEGAGDEDGEEEEEEEVPLANAKRLKAGIPSPIRRHRRAHPPDWGALPQHLTHECPSLRVDSPIRVDWAALTGSGLSQHLTLERSEVGASLLQVPLLMPSFCRPCWQTRPFRRPMATVAATLVARRPT